MDFAIDLGTANTLIHIRGRGIVLNEPSVVAVERDSGKVLAAGLEAKRMLGRTPGHVLAINPMRGGAIADVDRVDLMLRHFLEQVLPKRRFGPRPRALITVPSGITEMESRAVRAGIMAAGARQVFTIPEPIAAAVGAGFSIAAPKGNMVVNIGGGTTQIGVIALSGIVAEASSRVAGQDLDDMINAFVRRTYNLLIGDATAEMVKIQIGSVLSTEQDREIEVKGRDLVSGIPKTVRVHSEEIRECIQEPVQTIVGAVRRALEITPAELASDIVDEGILLTGGSARLRGLRCLIEHETQLPIHLDEDPQTTVVRGAGIVLENWKLYEDAVTG